MISAPTVRSFGGAGLLRGTKLVRMVYLDEAGISSRERFVVVAGVMIHGDVQLVPVEEHIEALVRKHIPEDDWDGFDFHATELWSGTKYFKDKVKWPLSKRLSILEDLVRIPADHGLCVVADYFDKENWPPGLAIQPLLRAELNTFGHELAFAYCTLGIEWVMRTSFSNEVSMLIAENRDDVRQHIKNSHALFREKNILKALPGFSAFLPLQKIRDTVHFADKAECRHLQIADTCAFFIRGHLAQKPHVARFYEILRPALAMKPGGIWAE